MIDRNTTVKAIVEGDVRVRSGSQALITGVIRGGLTVEPDAAAFLSGVVEGDMRVDGNALLIGVVHGTLTGSDESMFATGDRHWMK
jgi:hypothetical protein